MLSSAVFDCLSTVACESFFASLRLGSRGFLEDQKNYQAKSLKVGGLAPLRIMPCKSKKHISIFLLNLYLETLSNMGIGILLSRLHRLFVTHRFLLSPGIELSVFLT